MEIFVRKLFGLFLMSLALLSAAFISVIAFGVSYFTIFCLVIVFAVGLVSWVNAHFTFEKEELETVSNEQIEEQLNQ